MTWLCRNPCLLTVAKSAFLILFLTKGGHSRGNFYVELEFYEEKGNDWTTKCIKLCVTTSPSGFPKCNLKSTTGVTKVDLTHKRISPLYRRYLFPFSDWEDNSELSVIVWKLPKGKSCDTSSSTNTTKYGQSTVIIPRLERLKFLYFVTKNWKVGIGSCLLCNKRGCLLPCIPQQNDTTGHYTCEDGNKKCTPRWYGRNCQKTCVKSDDPPGNYQCSKTGKRICLPNWFGENCNTFCDSTLSKTYTCDVKGKKHCIANFYGVNCSIYCNDTASTYHCDKNGRKVCKINWFGLNCSRFCNTSKTNYLCSSNGSKICPNNWFGNLCDVFCNITAYNYKCLFDGRRKCRKNWFGSHCKTFCDTNASNYQCSENGSKTCFPNWFNDNCNKFCDLKATRYNCTHDGEKICSVNWFGNNCDKFCNNSLFHDYACNKTGDKVCSPGNKCSNHCEKITSTNDLYWCKRTKRSNHCPYKWHQRGCSKQCFQGQEDKMEQILNGCKTNPGEKQLCSQHSMDMDPNCESMTEGGNNFKRSSDKRISKLLVVGSSSSLLLISLVVVIIFFLRFRKKEERVVKPVIHVKENKSFDWVISEI
ncbi:protein draper-like [Xenia sp. Carnegie-2017]|uniref:protein draper-like n=1 Tax=Xenia sp. Carnegie-2017 TaxID=2897299 RepID=UPI001F03E703|nr:protein draper-like [Xenia sp. Carnegie-2017]